MLNDHLPDDDTRVAGWTDGEASLDIGANNPYREKHRIPLHLLCFSSFKQNENVLLPGQTADEINTSHFEIERSNDGNIFRKIGIIHAAYNIGTHYYNFTDNAPALGINYYRLKQVDNDARYTYSPIAKIGIEKRSSSINRFIQSGRQYHYYKIYR